MLKIEIPETEFFDERTSKIVRLSPAVIRLEHSLLSISKWEMIWNVPFLGKEKKTKEQINSYIEQMCLDPVDPSLLSRLGQTELNKINEYLEAKHSATWFSDEPKGSGSSPVVTSELIYYWMTAFGIPFECEKWPLSRLMNLIKIAQIKQDAQDPKKKRRSSTMLSERAALNAKRRAELNSKG